MKLKLPKTDSIKKLAKFWDSHDLTKFEDELEEVQQPVFSKFNAAPTIRLKLSSRESRSLQRLAESKGVHPQELVRRWVRQRISKKDKDRAA